jgi:hypothetical protein
MPAKQKMTLRCRIRQPEINRTQQDTTTRNVHIPWHVLRTSRHRTTETQIARSMTMPSAVEQCQATIVLFPSSVSCLPHYRTDTEFYTKIYKHLITSTRPRPQKKIKLTCVAEVDVLHSTLYGDTIELKLKDGSSISVSKRVLVQVPFFYKFFSKKAEQQSYSLLEDDSLAIQVVMAIFHHKPCQLPSAMTTQQLFGLATVCKKYGFTNIVSAHVECQAWITTLWHQIEPRDGDWEIWLYILRVFQATTENRCRYQHVIHVLAMNTVYHGGCWVLRRDQRQREISPIESAGVIVSLDSKYSSRLLQTTC